jgi:hypothetical protein
MKYTHRPLRRCPTTSLMCPTAQGRRGDFKRFYQWQLKLVPNVGTTVNA